jgi:hypothetical protein
MNMLLESRYGANDLAYWTNAVFGTQTLSMGKSQGCPERLSDFNDLPWTSFLLFGLGTLPHPQINTGISDLVSG